MRTKIRNSIHSIVLAAFAASSAHADEVVGLITFTAGTPARASEVNDNFAAVKTAVDGTHADVIALQQAVADLQDALAAQATQLTAVQSENAALAAENSALASQLDALSNQLSATEANLSALEIDNNTLASQLDGVLDSQVMALDAYLTVTGGTRPTVLLSGVNLQIVNGAGGTETSNGLGNLLVGYDEPYNFGDSFCSLGREPTRSDCESAGGVWSRNHKSGSHYVVVGSANNYSQFGGIVAGFRNSSINQYASVTGGTFNTASGYGAAVSGGVVNTASGDSTSVTGGRLNVASGSNASITSGTNNTASGYGSSVSGGTSNTASGNDSSVSGGNNRTAPSVSNWVAGSLLENN